MCLLLLISTLWVRNDVQSNTQGFSILMVQFDETCDREKNENSFISLMNITKACSFIIWTATAKIKNLTQFNFLIDIGFNMSWIQLKLLDSIWV